MAREKMITRTMITTEVEVMAVNIKTATVSTETYKLVGAYDNDKDIMKYLEKNFGRDTIKFVSVTDKHEIEQLYGMTESDFITMARILPPRTEK